VQVSTANLPSTNHCVNPLRPSCECCSTIHHLPRTLGSISGFLTSAEGPVHRTAGSRGREHFAVCIHHPVKPARGWDLLHPSTI